MAEESVDTSQPRMHGGVQLAPGQNPDGTFGDQKPAQGSEDKPQAPEDKGTPEAPERPEWLPEKFKTPEDMAKAYAELESKQGQKPEPKADDKPSEGGNSEDPKDSDAFTAAAEEFMRNGELSADSRKSLTDLGYDDAFVDMVMSGVKAQADTRINAVYEAAGGKDQYEAMFAWAGENLSEDEKAAFDQAIDASDGQAKLAVRALKASFEAANGSDWRPERPEGSNEAGSGVKPFSSDQEMVAAMSDPRYEKDPAYRKEVEQRAAGYQRRTIR